MPEGSLDRRLALCGLCEPVRLVFDLAAMLAEYEVFATRADAIAALARQAG